MRATSAWRRKIRRHVSPSSLKVETRRLSVVGALATRFQQRPASEARRMLLRLRHLRHRLQPRQRNSWQKISSSG